MKFTNGQGTLFRKYLSKSPTMYEELITDAHSQIIELVSAFDSGLEISGL